MISGHLYWSWSMFPSSFPFETTMAGQRSWKPTCGSWRLARFGRLKLSSSRLSEALGEWPMGDNKPDNIIGWLWLPSNDIGCNISDDYHRMIIKIGCQWRHLILMIIYDHHPQIIIFFIDINHDNHVKPGLIHPWSLFFSGSHVKSICNLHGASKYRMVARESGMMPTPTAPYLAKDTI